MIGRLADIVTNPIIPTQIEKNESCGMELLKIAAENIPGYALSLMFSFLLGELVDQAIEKNEEYANMFQTYALKDPDCMWNIGILYICGTVGDGKHTLSLPQDEKKGLNFLHQAAESSREKIYKLACGYLAGLMFYPFIAKIKSLKFSDSTVHVSKTAPIEIPFPKNEKEGWCLLEKLKNLRSQDNKII